MTRDQISQYFAAIAVMVLVFSPVLTVDAQLKPASISPSEQRVIPSSVYDAEADWDSIFGSVSITWLRNFVRDMSEDHPYRTWYPLDKAPSPQLEGGWTMANNTLMSITGGNLSFKIMTEYMNLVAIRNGSDSRLAPIIIAGTIAGPYSPGANAYAASVAGVLHVAYLLNNLTISNDVYFVLVNTYRSYHQPSGSNIGFRALLSTLENQGRHPATVLWMDSILYESEETNGDRLAIQFGQGGEVLEGSEYLAFLSTQVSAYAGNSRAVVKSTTNRYWDDSGSAEAINYGIPSIVFSQYYTESVSGRENDDWDFFYWSYTMLEEAAGIAASIIAYLGKISNGEAPIVERTTSLSAGSSKTIDIYLTGISSINVSVGWSDNTTIEAQIRNEFDVVLFSRVGDNNSLILNYTNEDTGEFSLRLLNSGTNSTTVQYNYTHWHDFDQDGLSDDLEYMYGTDGISSDTDNDLADDYSEVMVYGCDPLVQDTDGDGAIDGVEIMLGADPTIVDTDQDTLSDGFEIENGYDPTSNDTDGDQILDNVEVDLGLNPLSNDTDGDGLLDYQELLAGTDAASPDSDGDGLSDLFELLNYMDPLSQDSDKDGLSDAYEIENCLMPNNPDTDSDGIPDGVDWMPREHWMTIVPVAGFGIFLLVMILWLLMKRRTYSRSG
ncbi:MAG: exported protein of unknown function [Candidatus Thorarchaeota archaeon]|nr:MAG: exported protein of unknown function [Candidatus Thorarchaeota archaeon]